jgi:hypothetical protein
MGSVVRSQPPTTARSQRRVDLKLSKGSLSALPRRKEKNPEQSM